METAETATPRPARASRTQSGAQTQLRCGTQTATVVEVGGPGSRWPMTRPGPEWDCPGEQAVSAWGISPAPPLSETG